MSTLAAPRDALRNTPRAAPDGFEYALARLHARLAWRASEPTWQRLHAARSLPALLDVARSTTLAPYVAGIVVAATLPQIDLAFQTQLRGRIDEVAGWMPAPWQPAARWTASLIDLPARLREQHERGSSHQAHSALDPVPGIEHGVHHRSTALSGQPASPHPALAAWLHTWQQRWPSNCTALAAWSRRLAADLTALAAAEPATAPALREQLATRLAGDLHARAAPPQIAPFAFLALLALDLKRLRGECMRARLTMEAP
ncbi:MAG: hypothetical protein ING59_15775 [Burkholderiales bacterium]|jgi:hypothetical protein|nr:hypothetical protein [Burkholderiales bacterium]